MKIISNRDFEKFGVDVMHHFGDDGSGVYIKQTVIPAGVELAMHVHTFTHKSVLSRGRVRLTADGVSRDVEAPAVLTLREGVEHRVVALTDAVWLCIHATDENDPERIDHVLVGTA